MGMLMVNGPSGEDAIGPADSVACAGRSELLLEN
jgi:hypothetical protein